MLRLLCGDYIIVAICIALTGHVVVEVAYMQIDCPLWEGSVFDWCNVMEIWSL